MQPPISLADLQRLTEFFPTPGLEFKLDPTFEPERSPGDADADAAAKYGLAAPMGARMMSVESGV